MDVALPRQRQVLRPTAPLRRRQRAMGVAAPQRRMAPMDRQTTRAVPLRQSPKIHKGMYCCRATRLPSRRCPHLRPPPHQQLERQGALPFRIWASPPVFAIATAPATAATIVAPTATATLMEMGITLPSAQRLACQMVLAPTRSQPGGEASAAAAAWAESLRWFGPAPVAGGEDGAARQAAEKGRPGHRVQLALDLESPVGSAVPPSSSPTAPSHWAARRG